LTNVIRHAKASHVDVQVIQDGEVIVLVVRDNGKGISAGQQAHRNA
jgi:signal transduction histidine kinase